MIVTGLCHVAWGLATRIVPDRRRPGCLALQAVSIGLHLYPPSPPPPPPPRGGGGGGGGGSKTAWATSNFNRIFTVQKKALHPPF